MVHVSGSNGCQSIGITIFPQSLAEDLLCCTQSAASGELPTRRTAVLREVLERREQVFSFQSGGPSSWASLVVVDADEV